MKLKNDALHHLVHSNFGFDNILVSEKFLEILKNLFSKASCEVKNDALHHLVHINFGFDNILFSEKFLEILKNLFSKRFLSKKTKNDFL